MQLVGQMTFIAAAWTFPVAGFFAGDPKDFNKLAVGTTGYPD